jgi:hypothetical protein
MHADETYAYEMHADEMHADEMHADEMHADETLADETLADETLADEMKSTLGRSLELNHVSSQYKCVHSLSYVDLCCPALCSALAPTPELPPFRRCHLSP